MWEKFFGMLKISNQDTRSPLVLFHINRLIGMLLEVAYIFVSYLYKYMVYCGYGRVYLYWGYGQLYSTLL